MRPVFLKGEKKLRVKGWLGHFRSGWCLGSLCAICFSSAALALPPVLGSSVSSVSVVDEGGTERVVVDLGGVLLSALSPELQAEEAGPERNAQGVAEDGLLLLVRPWRSPDGPRRILRLRLHLGEQPELERVVEGLEGWIERIVAVDFAGGSRSPGPSHSSTPSRTSAAVHLIAAGGGKLADLGPLSALFASPQPLAVGTPFDLASFDAARLHRGVESGLTALEPGHLLLWQPAAPARAISVPFAVARTASGLRLTGLPVAALHSTDGAANSPGYLAGPEAVGSTRLRSLKIVPTAAGEVGASADASTELWASLPGPERVSQSWPFEIDGVPVLVVRTQGSLETNLFERQRLRVLILASDRTRAGSLPALAVELDSKRWHATAVALGDVDGDGHADLLAAFPEGLSGSDLVVQWWRGLGAGRFEARVHRSDINRAPAGWQLIGTGENGERPGVLLAGKERVEWRRFSASGSAALESRAALSASLPVAKPGGPKSKSPRKKPEESPDESGDDPPETRAVPLGLTRSGLLALWSDGAGTQRLILLRPRSSPSPG